MGNEKTNAGINLVPILAVIKSLFTGKINIRPPTTTPISRSLTTMVRECCALYRPQKYMTSGLDYFRGLGVNYQIWS